jgi:hypothetical protein
MYPSINGCVIIDDIVPDPNIDKHDAPHISVALVADFHLPLPPQYSTHAVQQINRQISVLAAMPPILKVSVGPNVDELKEITYNDNSTHSVRSPKFDGLVTVHIKGETGVAENSSDTYFTHETRSTCTWSMRIQGASDEAHEDN